MERAKGWMGGEEGREGGGGPINVSIVLTAIVISFVFLEDVHYTHIIDRFSHISIYILCVCVCAQ